MKETRLINRFSGKKKFFIWGNGPYWAQKLHILITLDPLEEFFKNFAKWKGLITKLVTRHPESHLCYRNCSCCIWNKNYPKPKPWTLCSINLVAIIEDVFCSLGPLIIIVLIKKVLFSHVNNVALEVFNFEKLNFSKTTVAYGTF